MLQNYLKLTLRTLYRNRLFTALNVVGMAIGLSAAWVVWQYWHFEHSYDRPIAEAERLYRVVSNMEMDGKRSGISGCPEPLSRATETVAGIEKAIPVVDLWTLSAVPQGAQKPFDEAPNVVKTVVDYFGLVPYRWLAGDRSTVLSQPDEVVLTRSRAELYFPKLPFEAVLGKQITYNFMEDTTLARVVGVVEDLDFPSNFIGQEFISLRKPTQDQWSNTNSGDQLWLLLEKDADPVTVAAAINVLTDRHAQQDLNKWRMKRTLALQPLAKVHFDPEFRSNSRTANPLVLAVLPGVAAFLLLLACINYINLTTAQIPLRAREIGVRKTMGSSRQGLVWGFLGETLLVCLLAVVLAALLTSQAFTFLKKDLPDDVLRYVDWPSTGLFLASLLLVVTVASGLYPGWLIGRFQAVSLLKGTFSGQQKAKSNRAALRKGLIVFQFFVAQAFIIVALVVGQQLQFMLQKDLGFDREAVVVASIPFKTAQNPAFKGTAKVLADALRKLPEVEQVALGDPLFSGGQSSGTQSRINAKGEKIEHSIFRKRSDGQLADFYKVPVLAGRGWQDATNDLEIILNESASRVLGFDNPQSAIGQQISDNRPNKVPRTVVGVVADFHTGEFSQKIEPTAFFTDTDFRTFNIRLTGHGSANWSVASAKIAAEWAKVYPDDAFEAQFYDDTMRRVYAADLSTARLVNAATGIAVLISCLGLFGLATFTALRRTKEIGIRKVLGASVASVVKLLSEEFLLLVGIGFVLAVPLTIYLLQGWLARFVYRIDMQWWMFVVAGVLAITIAFLTVSFQSVKAALANPVKSLRNE